MVTPVVPPVVPPVVLPDVLPLVEAVGTATLALLLPKPVELPGR